MEHHTSPLANRILTAALLLVIGAGVAMRLYRLGEHPYGLYQDEAYYGLDALGVLDGQHALYFPANNGREPLFIYLMAATVALFGPTPVGVRAAAAIFGILTIAATYLLGAAWSNRRTGLLAAAILSATLWHVHLSRVGFRAVSLPLFVGLALGLAAMGLRTRSRWALAGAGIAYGLSFYTYLAARFTPFALIGMLAYGLIWQRDWLRTHWRDLLWIAIPAFIVALPLGILALIQPDLVFGRSGQVGIWNPAIHQGDLIGAALRSVAGGLGMFAWRGDRIWRHNIPTRPVFDPIMSLAFLGGVGLAIARWRKRPELSLALIWVAVMLAPTMLAEDSPHFLRAVGVLPVVALITALALDELLRVSESRVVGARYIAPLPMASGVAIALIVSAALTYRDYFGCRDARFHVNAYDYTGCYANDPIRGYFFQAQATDLAREALAADGPVYLDRRFPDTFASVRFLLARRTDVILFDEGQPLPPADPPFTLITWPHGDLAPTLAAIPPQARVMVVPGPLTRGDQEPEPYRLYVRWTVEPFEREPTPPLARFTNGIDLLDVITAQDGSMLSVRLVWSSAGMIAGPVQMFVHVIGPDSATPLAQADEPPGTAYYPPLSWTPGSVIIQPVSLPLGGLEVKGLQLRIGLYDPTTGDRWPILDAEITTDDNALIIPLDPGRAE